MLARISKRTGRVFHDVSGSAVEVLAIVPKPEAEFRSTLASSPVTFTNICLHLHDAHFAMIGATAVLHLREEGAIMKKLIIAAAALAGLTALGGCIAVPVYTPEAYGGPAYYGPPVGVGVGIYAGPRYYGGGYRGGGHRHRNWR
jgi:hypothetical protein